MSVPPRRPIKVIVISDYLCSYCYIVHKILHDAIDACRDLPVRFDVEFRPFSLLCPSSDALMGLSRSAYLAKRFGKQEAEAKMKVVADMAEKAGLKLADDGVVCRSTQAHRLAVKAYQVGGQPMQEELNSLIFEACLARGEDISSDNFLVDVAVKVGLMNRERAIEFLKSTEVADCVEKMIDAARANGVKGVPFVIIDGKWALNGVQPVECYIQIFRKLAQSPRPAKGCHGCKDPTIGTVLSVQ